MGKPEIIGYQTDPDNWSAPRMPDITYDSDGIQIPCISIGYDGKPYEDTRYLGEDEIDGFMRHHGMKRVYKPREFHAGSAGEDGSYRVHCKTCAIDFIAVNMLPHDAAKLHVESGHQSGISWADLVA
jgi:hypothetical protein